MAIALEQVDGGPHSAIEVDFPALAAALGDGNLPDDKEALLTLAAHASRLSEALAEVASTL